MLQVCPLPPPRDRGIFKLNACLRGSKALALQARGFSVFQSWDGTEGESRGCCRCLSATTVAFTKDQRSERGDILRMSDKYMYIRGPRARSRGLVKGIEHDRAARGD